jgi:cobalt-precorrin 5A hydrolase / precorrin-3B C17-methyltransferase
MRSLAQGRYDQIFGFAVTELAIIVLNSQSVLHARHIQQAFPKSTIYGLADRTANVDISFTEFGTTLRDLFAKGVPIVGFCAAGILIRTLAPVLSDKRQEPPVLAIAEDGSAVVPLLGGLHGVNDLARQISRLFEVSPAITTSGDIRFHTALFSPPPGYHLANPEVAKTFIADLLAGASIQLEGSAPWISNSRIPIAPAANLTIQITEYAVPAQSNRLVYHPATVAMILNPQISMEPEIAIATMRQTLSNLQIAPPSIAAIVTSENHANHPGIQAIAQTYQAPVRLFPADWNPDATVGEIIFANDDCTIAIAPLPLDINTIGRAQGKLAIVGTGPGSLQWMSPQVRDLLRSATDWVGYGTYLNLVEPLRQGQQRHESDNRVELDRARQALDLAVEGRSVVVVSSGDPGIYGMAAAVFEVIERDDKPEWQQIEIQVAPGISAMQGAASLMGAPIGHDFCAISLSDILKPWEVVEQRILAAATADLVIAFYNPISSQRTWQLAKAKDLLLQVRSPTTPLILARNVGRPQQSITITTLAQFEPTDADMRTLILVGSSQTRVLTQPYRKWVYTPRWYPDSEFG